MGISIRQSQETDIAAIAAIYAIYATSVIADTASWDYEPPNLEEIAQRRRDVLSKKFPYLVACDEGSVMGFACASNYRTRVGYRFVVEDSVYVKSGFQGRGIGHNYSTH